MKGQHQQDNAGELDEPPKTLVATPEASPRPPIFHLYTPLSASRDEFRLVELLPSPSFDTPIICQIIHASLRSPPKYEAVSYVWGPPPFTSLIELSTSTAFPVGENLELALRYLRFPSEKRLLWVDALCINQADFDERSQQVKRMRDIFQFSKVVLVYLGPYPSQARELCARELLPEYVDDNGNEIPTDPSKVAERMKDILKELKDGLELMKNISEKDISTLQYMKDETKREMAWNRHVDGNGWLLDWEQRLSLESVFKDSPIWDRVWIVQELSSRRVLLVGGTSTLDWEKVSSFLGDSHYADAFHGPFGHGSVATITSRIFSNPTTINHQRGIFRDIGEGYTSTFFDVLARFRHRKATDPHDQIYGMLGLVSENHPIVPDYNKSHQRVFTDLAIHIMNSTANLDLLCQSPWSDNPNPRPEDLPSWVPDFTYEGHSVRLFAQRSIFSAGASTCKTPLTVTEDGMLNLRGTTLGRIGPFPEVDDSTNNDSDSSSVDDESPPRKWMLQYFGTRLLDDSSSTYVTGEPSLQAYWCTLLASCKFQPDDQSNRTIKRLNKDDILNYGKKFTSLLRGDPDVSLWDQEYRPMAYRMFNHWVFAMTQDSLYLMVQSHVKGGDLVVILKGAKVPVVLRPIRENADASDEMKYEFISTAYVHGFMDGEAARWVEEGKLKEEGFCLV